ncbi:MAG TPA: DMT family transporter [Chthoniobacterales bacterium]|nr:DMT family transporter [Chthoniobacterales bacterium]
MKQPAAVGGIVDLRGRANLSRGYAALFATVVIWSMPSLFQYYLIRYYDPWAQNFYRYLAACLAVVPFVFLHLRRPATAGKIDVHAFAICLIPCLPNVIHQITQVVALYYIGPGVYAIFTRSSVIFTALLALIFFPEERYVIRQWQFQTGTLLGLLGAFGVVWFQTGWQTGPIPFRGLVIAFTATFCWALYSILVKRPSAQLGSIRSFGVISLITSTLLLPLTLLFGNIDTPLRVGANVNVILVVSAVSCITLAHVLYYVAIQEIGVALAQSLQLLCPAGALALSAWIFGERLTYPQLWSAAILLLGAFLAMQTKPGATTETAENL